MSHASGLSILASAMCSYFAMQNFLTSFLTEDLPGMMVLPKRLVVDIPPAVTAVAEAAVGRGAVMRAVASAVLQADAVEQSLAAALPLGPQKPAGGVSLPESFQVLALFCCGQSDSGRFTQSQRSMPGMSVVDRKCS